MWVSSKDYLLKNALICIREQLHILDQIFITSVSINKQTSYYYAQRYCMDQNLHWKLEQQTPSAGTLLAYLETTASIIFFLGIKL